MFQRTTYKYLATRVDKLWLENRKTNARKHTFTRTAWSPRSVNTPYFAGIEYQRDKAKGAKFKFIRGSQFSIAQFFILGQW
jgi:hypothetical protein